MPGRKAGLHHALDASQSGRQVEPGHSDPGASGTKSTNILSTGGELGQFQAELWVCFACVFVARTQVSLFASDPLPLIPDSL